MLELINVKKYYKDNRAVDGISFYAGRGEILGLIGANGAGKTTTLSMIATLIKPDSGNIIYDGRDIVHNPTALRKHLGYVPQEIALYPSLSGYDNLRFWGRANHVYGKKLKQRVEEVSQMISLEASDLNKRVSSYSGGMKRRLNIGAALLHEPRLVIMDEPAAGLDVLSRNQILKTVTELKKSGAAIIYSGHNLDEMEQICDNICIIDRGKCILFGKKEELLTKNTGLEQLLLKAIQSR